MPQCWTCCFSCTTLMLSWSAHASCFNTSCRHAAICCPHSPGSFWGEGGVRSHTISVLLDLLFPEEQALKRTSPEECAHNRSFTCHLPLCRVYLIGGAEATGNSNDTALVYTPVYYADYDGERHMLIWNMTLPLHFFSRAPGDVQAGKHSLKP